VPPGVPLEQMMVPKSNTNAPLALLAISIVATASTPANLLGMYLLITFLFYMV
jgi:hypothetical protein